MGSVIVPHSNLKRAIVELMRSEGYIKDVAVQGDKKKELVISLKYKGKFCSIQNLKQISKPSLRVYVESAKMPRVLNGLGIAVVSTSQGLMTGSDAVKKGVGGELLATSMAHPDQRKANMDQGTLNSSLAGAIKGVSEGYVKLLKIEGVGFKAVIKGQTLVLSLGFSHPVEMPIPHGIKAEAITNTELKISGFNKQLVGEFAANVRD
ncbi:unnamed protein product [Didymodactylos carnosus]|uniref:Large ribosomal subunit protein uL6 n=1 Tax=Didymodactylos carnosus TaxID=1234261 RepID=A0A8S2GLN8_9BILA|nr:unnamed protein product [Didymodactylos carnosus]CAF3532481.1 unnamed protein product [Didymodactylos carnosus]